MYTVRTGHAVIQVCGINSNQDTPEVGGSQTSMLLLFLIHLLSVRALPVPVINESIPPYSCTDYNSCRSLLSIIWSCITTIFLCTWVAIHPNIPKPVDTRDMSFWGKRANQLSRLFKGKMVMFICALLVPEYILAWAIRQLLMTRRIAKENGMCKQIVSLCSSDMNTDR